MKKTLKTKWMASLLCLLALAFALPVSAQEEDDLQAYLDQLAVQQSSETQPLQGMRKARGVDIPVGLTEVDLSTFSATQRKKSLVVSSSCKFVNGTLTASSSFSGGGCMVMIKNGATVVMDSSVKFDASNATSSNCLATVGIYDCGYNTTFYALGDIIAPNNGTGYAVYIECQSGTLYYYHSKLTGSIYNPNNGTMINMEDPNPPGPTPAQLLEKLNDIGSDINTALAIWNNANDLYTQLADRLPASDYAKVVAKMNELKNDRMYAVKVSKDVDVEISGGLLTSITQRTINLVEQWNYIGYTPNVNLPIATALSEYFDYANDGDMVKSQHEFAVFRKYGDYDGEWKGNLKYLKTGEGYMLFRNSKSGAQFTYPFVKPGTSFFDGSTNTAQAPAYHNSFGSSMALIALPTGIEIQPGDRLIAYGDAEIRGVAEADEDGNFYISIGGDKQVPLAFGIEREGLLVALSPEVMSYQANDISGKPDNPTRIDFVKTDFADGYWYTLQGVRLNHKPAQSGVYIFNGKKVVVK